MTNRLRGKTALVTGSTSNIGRAVAITLAREGAHVIVSGRDAARGMGVVDQILAKGGQADFVAADLDGAAVVSSKLADDSVSLLGGRIDILVNNAGIFPAEMTAMTTEKRSTASTL